MSFRLFFFAMIFSIQAFGKTVNTQIHEIVLASSMDEETLIYLSGGQILKLTNDKSVFLGMLQSAKKSNSWLEINYDEKRQILSISSITPPYRVTRLKSLPFHSPYNPSVLNSFEDATKFHQASRRTTKESQCFNRAHVWTHDWRIKHNFYSMKIFLFFTPKYIRKFNFEWWFHVAPFVYVQDSQGVIRERVLDIKYGNGPLKIKQWTDIFMKDDASCPLVEKYSDHANNPESSTCYLMKASMYYYQPQDLELLEVQNIEKTYWVESEVKNAYLEAFEINI